MKWSKKRKRKPNFIIWLSRAVSDQMYQSVSGSYKSKHIELEKRLKCEWGIQSNIWFLENSPEKMRMLFG